MKKSIADNTNNKSISVKNAVRLSVVVCGCLAVSSCGLGNYLGLQQQASAHSQTASPALKSDLSAARAAFARGNYGIAIDHLESELARSPASVSALNGLGSSYDQLGRYEVAQRYYFRALDLAPQSSLTIGNIGYSYLLQGRNLEAASLFQLALNYDSANTVAAANLGLAKQAPTWVAHEPEPTMDPNLRVEVSNGNGINGMGARLREFLKHQGASVVRLTNDDNFTHLRTTIYYREGYFAAAQALAASFPTYTITLQQSDRLSDRVDARLLIGLDFSLFESEKHATAQMLAHFTQ